MLYERRLPFVRLSDSGIYPPPFFWLRLACAAAGSLVSHEFAANLALVGIALMSKSKKRLIVRLSLVTAVVALGVYALVQAQAVGASPAGSGGAHDGSGESSPDKKAAGEPVTSVRPDSGDEQSPADDLIVRGQGGGAFQAANGPPPPKPGRFQPTTDSPLKKEDASGGAGSGQFKNAAPILPPSTAPSQTPQPKGPASVLAQPPARPTLQAPVVNERDARAQDLIGKGAEREVTKSPALIIEPSKEPPTTVPERTVAPTYTAQDLSPATVGGTPGPAHLEGLRTPSIALEKRAPKEIQVGKPAIFEIKVQNVGRVDAEQVAVLDEIPAGTRFVDATPEPASAGQGRIVWQLGTLEPGKEETISIQLMPLKEGEIGSVARVVFESQASARTICTRPQLTVEVAAPPRVLIGEDVTLAIRISNPGTGAATGVILEEDVPAGLSHAAGNELEFEIGTLRPGESQGRATDTDRRKAGQIQNLLLVRGDGNLLAEDAALIEVVAPQLAISTSGPGKRYLERKATYEIEIENPGTATANEVEVIAYLHKGMKFIETNNYGQYDAQSHAVFWSLEELPAKDAGKVEVTVLPIETGQQKLRVESRANLGLADAKEHLVSVEGLAAAVL